MTIIEQLYAIVKSLPQEQASEILTFAELIRAQHLNAKESIHKLIQGLRKLQKDWNLSLLEKRLTNNTVNHIYVDDAYIYQIE
jgi:hypothetical protein